MNADVKTKWLEALRSGNYIQGQRYLKTTGGGVTRHCCLGILCDIADEGVVENVTLVNQTYEFDNHASALPESVRQWAGISSPLGEFWDAGQKNNLAYLNDGGSSFREIADIIEQNL